MKFFLIIYLPFLFWVAGNCENAYCGGKKPMTYTVYFQIDSLDNFLKPSSSTNTFNTPKRYKGYALKILKENSIPKNNFVTRFYFTPTTNGFILTEPGEDRLNSLRLDKRIDSLVKDTSSMAF